MSELARLWRVPCPSRLGLGFPQPSPSLWNGKLRKLTDISRVEDQDDIWGELLEDNGDKWRIKFHPTDFDKARKLFTKQVIVFGDASYFKTTFPRIDVKDIFEEKKRDYVAAFDRFSHEYETVFGDRDPQKILNDIRGR
jgi:hypothetical protein